jgi:hypothetical protein
VSEKMVSIAGDAGLQREAVVFRFAYLRGAQMGKRAIDVVPHYLSGGGSR